MSQNKKRNVIHSVRMDQELEDFLNRESESRHMTFNNLVNSILFRYSEFGSFAERFGFITITRNTFQAIVSAIDDDEIESIARNISSLALKEFTYFRYRDPGVKAFIDFIATLCSYGGIGMFDEKVQGLDHLLIVRHNLGMKVSRLFGQIFSQTLKRMADIEVKVQDASASEVDISFRMDPFSL